MPCTNACDVGFPPVGRRARRISLGREAWRRAPSGPSPRTGSPPPARLCNRPQAWSDRTRYPVHLHAAQQMDLDHPQYRPPSGGQRGGSDRRPGVVQPPWRKPGTQSWGCQRSEIRLGGNLARRGDDRSERLTPGGRGGGTT
ncbi:RNaseH domain-containing protein [Streptomyces longwoodensis]|uniref:RNaseH domain-containing protein n=1 Tax=Streptomyces longwoodensis TaxID=68231 RepID=UPI00131C5C33